MEYRVLHADGEVRWVCERGRAVFAADSDQVLWLDGVVFDHTDRTELEQRLEHLAYHDALTGLPNRALFRDHVDVAIARARRHGGFAAVLFIDLDNFKLVNDSFGHTLGDQMLCDVSARLRQAVRDCDVVARQGGDAFLILMADIWTGGDHGLAAQAAARMAKRIRETLSAPVSVSDIDVHASASVGISVYPTHASTVDELLKDADVAMYRAKDGGRDGYRLHSEEGDAAITRLSMASRLRRAVAQEQFVLHYQPLVELASGNIVGAEALIRRHDPEMGLVPPGEFIPLAEGTSLIEPISDWVLAEECRQSAEWRSHGLDLLVSVNLPARFWQPTAMRCVLDTIESFEISSNRLMVEITESAAMSAGQSDGIISELRDRGLQVAIDDFGTGHSSLTRLSQMHVTTLKIDRSFVNDLPHDRKAAILVRNIIQLSHNFGLQPLAEGIETSGQRDFLIEQGCRLGQGYHFSRPVPPEEIVTYASTSAAAVASS